jgi:hypothetical protein
MAKHLLVGVAISLLLLGCMPVDPRPASEEAKRRQEAEIALVKAIGLDAPVKLYFLRHNQWPTDLSVLADPDPDNDDKPYVADDDILDPWGQPFQIDPDGPHNKGKKPDIFTMAPNGKNIGNWLTK